MAVCENCGKEHDGLFGSGRFCCRSCSNAYSTKSKRQEINEKVSQKMSGRTLDTGHKQNISQAISEKHRQATIGFTGKKHTEESKRKIAKTRQNNINERQEITSLMQLSSRTITKILKRMEIGCSRCGWNESTCDIHHIHGRKIPNPDAHENLTYICPNCHRLVHTHKISADELVSLSQQIGDKWREYYYWS